MKYVCIPVVFLGLVSPWDWSLPLATVIGLLIFWSDLVRLNNQAMIDLRVWMLDYQGPHGNVNGNARIAWEVRRMRK
jgi:hypothetical protein